MTGLQDRNYGNWQRPSSPGLGRLGLLGTVVLMAGSVLVIGVLAVAGLVPGLILAVLLGVGLAPLYWPDRWGRTAYERGAERIAWMSARRKKHNRYVTGPLSRTPDVRCRVPGLAASMTATEALDAVGDPFVLLHHPGTGHVSVVIEAAPAGDTMVDPEQVDDMVAHWGQWLADLGHESDLVAASVTIESAPETGVRLRRGVEARIAADAPPMAAAAIRDVVHTLHRGSTSVTCRIALTWARSRAGAKRRTVDDMAIEIGSRLPQLCRALQPTGAGTAQPMTEKQLAAAIRVAYDPDIAVSLDEADPGDIPGWADAGPVSAEEYAGSYVHDNATSVSWVMGEAPRGAVRSTILRRLLEPHREIGRKRVTLLYRPYAPHRASEIVDQDVRDATFNAGQRSRVRARDSVSLNAAASTAAEEARGSGLTRFAMVVTATVPGSDPDAIDRCCSIIEHLGTGARIRLRRAWRTQAVTFTAGLPLGLVLPQHVAVPGDWRERV